MSYKGSLRSTSTASHLHPDTREPIKVEVVVGFRYFVTVVDEYTSYAHTCPIKTNGEAFDVVL